MANNQAFKIKNGLSAKRYLQNSTAVSASDVDLSTGSYFTKTLSANTTFTFSNPPASGKAMGFALEVTGANVAVGYDFDNLSYASKSFSVLSQDSVPRALELSSDGTKMYVLGQINQTVYQYSLSTAYDVSTASYSSKSFGVSTQETSPTALAFKSDGTKMYVGGFASDAIYQYSLSTAWDVSTASYDSKSFSTATIDTQILDMKFKPDGTRLFFSGNGSDRVYQLNLSTAWDISTATGAPYVVVSTEDTAPSGIAFNADGTEMYMVGATGDDINLYSLSTAWTINTASFQNKTFFIQSQETQPMGLTTSPDGLYLYLVGYTYDQVHQYNFFSNAPATVAWPSSVKWSGATAPDAPASGEKDVYVFVTTDGGTTYYGKQAGDAVA